MRVNVRRVAGHGRIIVKIATLLLKVHVARAGLRINRRAGGFVDVVPRISWFQRVVRPRRFPGRPIDRRRPSN